MPSLHPAIDINVNSQVLGPLCVYLMHGRFQRDRALTCFLLLGYRLWPEATWRGMGLFHRTLHHRHERKCGQEVKQKPQEGCCLLPYSPWLTQSLSFQKILACVRSTEKLTSTAVSFWVGNLSVLSSNRPVFHFRRGNVWIHRREGRSLHDNIKKFMELKRARLGVWC